jgi:hypothetical protein
MQSQPGNPRNQGRMIDISSTKVSSAGDVVQFVAKDPVPTSRQQMSKDYDTGNGENDARA